MNELGIQKWMVDTVNDAGGFAHKMNNRFLIGVSDLLVKLPKWPAGFLEVKQRARPVTGDVTFALDITRPQRQFLAKAHAGGMPVGAASFMQAGSGSGLRLWLRILTWRELCEAERPPTGYVVIRDSHVELGTHRDRSHALLSALHSWQEECKRERR